MFEITINDQTVLVPKGSTVLEACRFAGIDIPRFCYHDRLSVAGNCRMCLVEIEKTPKPVASCAMPVSHQMVVYTDTPLVKKARENVLETLLLNHPLDCPICDQGGECDLQDQTRIYGSDYTRFYTEKRSVEDKYFGPLIKTIMTRCIHCTRCVRYAAEIAGVDILGTINRGGHTEIGAYLPRVFQTEIAGNVIDLCPVGALTSKPYAFTARPWELRTAESVDVLDSIGSNIFIDFKETEALRVLPRLNEDVNEEWISDRIRFSYDAIRRQRISDIYLRVNDKFVQQDWSDCLNLLNNKFNNSNILILVPSSIDIQSFNLLQSLANKSNVRLACVDANLARSYNTVWENSATILDLEKSDICFLLGVNPRYEGAVLNIRIRAQYLKGNYSIVQIGAPYKANISTNFLGISLNEIFNIFEGRSSLQQVISNAKQPYFVIGDSLTKRLDLNLIHTHLSQLNTNSKVLHLSAKINTNHSIFQNVRKFKMQDLNWSDAVMALYLDDNQATRKILNAAQSKFKIWGHSNGSVAASLNDLILPLSSFVEEENEYLNAESRYLKTSRVFTPVKSIRSLSLLAKALGADTKLVNPFSFFSNDEVYSTYASSKKVFTTFINTKVQNADLCSFLPFKSTIEDFYLVDSFTRSSQIMGQCSSIFRKHAVNFL
jgi:NADH-quinone oxidoreductase chain G